MAKKMKRLLALVLALALVGGQLSIPALAEEKPADLEVTVTTAEDGTQTTTTTYTDPETGAQVTVTQTQSVYTSDDGSRTDINTTWENTETQTGSVTEGATTVDTDVTKVVEGEEKQTEIREGNVVKNQLSGQETTTVTGTTVTTTTQEGVITGNTTVTEDTRTENLTGGSTSTDNGYVTGRETVGQWEEGEIREGDITGSKTETETDNIDIEHEGDVTLNLKPDEKWVTKSYDIALEDLTDVPAGATVTEKKDHQGNVIGWTVTYREKVTTVSDGTSVQEGSWTAVGQEQNTYVNPGNYTVGTTVTGDDLSTVANGESVTTVIEEIYENGIYQGYRIITVTTTKVTGETADEEVGTRTDAGYTQDVGETLNTGYTMPEEPVASVTENEDGTTTTVSYTVMEENGEPRGYCILTEVRDAAGKLIRTESRNLYGTSHTSQTTVETDPTAERTTTTTLVTRTDVQEIRTVETTLDMEKTDTRVENYTTTVIDETDTYELIETDAGTFFLYQGKMYRVEAVGSHGQADVQTLTPDSKYITAAKGSDLRNKNGTATGLFSGYSDESKDNHPDGYEFRYVGNGAASTLRVRYENGGSTTAHQFALRDSEGNLHYVYCCDLNTSAVQGAYYEIENLKDAGYYSTDEGTDIVDHIRTIATNGFWATAGNGTGSLASVKALLKAYGYSDVADSITEGEALTATQAALWAFGNRGTKPSNTDIVHATRTTGISSNAADEKNVMTLYKLLISDQLKNATRDNSTDLIDKEDIAGSSITVHEAVGTQEGKTVYNTDVSFQLDVSKSSITGNLVVKVVQDGRVIRTEHIATEDSNFMGKLLAGKETNGTTTYTIEGLELMEGVSFTLNLEGTQNMEEGVYLYTAKGGNAASQTFVGLASGERDVDLEVDLVFQVSDPEVKHTNRVVTATRKDTREATRVSTRTDRKVNTREVTSGKIDTDVSHAIGIVSTVTTTETKQDITKEERSWEAYWEYLLELVEDDDGDDDGFTIEDEEVPLADAPRTGDLSLLWAAVSAISLSGVIAVSVWRKENV